MNLKKKTKLLFIVIIMITNISIQQVRAYYATNVEKNINFTTQAFENITLSLDKTIYGSCNKLTYVNLRVENPNSYQISYEISFSNNEPIYLIDDLPVTTYNLNAFSSKNHTIEINGETGIQIVLTFKVTLPYSATYTKTINFDDVCPTGVIASTNNVATSQTATLTMTDNRGVTSYYWGTSSSPTTSDYTTITSTTSTSVTKTVNDAGTYYLFVKDASGNVSSSTNKTFYKTTLTMSNGTVSPTSVITMNGNNFKLPTPTAKTGYTNNGAWYTSTAYSTSKGNYGATYIPTSNTTLYSIAIANTYTVSYSCGAGSGTAPTSHIATYDSTFTIKANTCTRTGYTFAGWTVNSNGTADSNGWTGWSGTWKYVNGQYGIANGKLQLYAMWTVNTYTIDYVDNRFNAASTPTTTNGLTYSYNSSNYQLTLNGTPTAFPTLQLADHKFIAGEKYSIKLTYVSGTVSGYGVLVTESKKYGGESLSKRNYVDCYFPTSGSYSTEITFTAVSANEGQILENWIYYYNEGITFSNYVIKVEIAKVNTQTKTYGTTLGTLSAPTRIGYTFNGWYTAPSGGTQVTSSTAVPAANTTYYARWTINSYDLTYDCSTNGGSGDTNVNLNYNTSADLSKTCTKTGWQFIGWNTSSTATTALSSFNMPATADTLYAIYKKVVNITFNANGCTTENGSATITLYNVGTSGNVAVPTKTMNSGWTSLGASASSSSTSGTAMGSSMSISGISDATTSIARYYNCSKDVTVTFNANGCTTTSPTASMAVYNGSTSGMAVVPSATLNSGWTNLGASTSSSATSGTAVNSTLNITGVASSSTTANAYYTCKKNSKTYTVTFSCNGGSGTVSSTSCTIPAVYNGATQGTTCSINAPSSGCSRSDWNFVGWNASNSGTTGFTGDASINQNRSYYAIWKKPAITYTLSFASAASGASGSTSSKSCTIPEVYNGADQATSCSVTLPTNGFSYSGWTFNGWGTSSTATSGSGSDTSVSISSNTTRYATWYKASKTYTASFSCNGGSGTVSSTSCTIPAVYNGATQNSSCSISTPTSGCSRNGCGFGGWSTNSSGTTGVTGTTSIDQNRSYYAIWKCNLLYSVLEKEATSGSGLAKTYTGAHQDSYAKTGTNNIYHYYAYADDQEIYILDINNVIFADFCWQMIRTTDTGGVKMIYNGEAVDGKCLNTRSNHIGFAFGINKTLSSNYYYGTSYTYDESTGKFILAGTLTQAIWSDDTANDLIGLYTCASSSATGTCTTLYYVESKDSSTSAYVLPLKAGAHYSTIGEVQFNAITDSPAYVGYMYNTVYPKKTTISDPTSYEGKLFANSYYYKDGNYYLSGEQNNLIPWGATDSNFKDKHYTCFNTTGVCKTVYYVYYRNYTEMYHINLTGGKSVSDALAEMLSVDNVNTTNSTIKSAIDAWYKQNMLSYTSYLEDTIFCNDRSIGNLDSWNPNDGNIKYGSFEFYNNWSSSDLSCTNETDKFSVSNPKAKLTYPVGLASRAEKDLLDKAKLRATGGSYWLASPGYFGTDGANVMLVNSAGNAINGIVSAIGGTRPVISLKSGTTYSSGDGSMENPYVVDLN